jgi:hypothetical protein
MITAAAAASGRPSISPFSWDKVEPQNSDSGAAPVRVYSRQLNADLLPGIFLVLAYSAQLMLLKNQEKTLIMLLLQELLMLRKPSSRIQQEEVQQQFKLTSSRGWLNWKKQKKIWCIQVCWWTTIIWDMCQKLCRRPRFAESPVMISSTWHLFLQWSGRWRIPAIYSLATCQGLLKDESGTCLSFLQYCW